MRLPPVTPTPAFCCKAVVAERVDRNRNWDTASAVTASSRPKAGGGVADEVDGEDRGETAGRCSHDAPFAQDGSRIRKNRDIVARLPSRKATPRTTPNLSH